MRLSLCIIIAGGGDAFHAAVWPGMGQVAISAGYYLTAKLGARLLAEFRPLDLFDMEHVEVQGASSAWGAGPRAGCLSGGTRWKSATWTPKASTTSSSSSSGREKIAQRPESTCVIRGKSGCYSDSRVGLPCASLRTGCAAAQGSAGQAHAAITLS